MLFTDLIVWQKAMALAADIYKITKSLPKDEIYGLVSQMRRAAVSIPSNIAEGYARYHTKEYTNFLSMALGSAAELETQLYLCINLEFLEKEITENSLNILKEVSKMLIAIINKLTPET
jgi:S23 ribosomal protein.